jgi:hypothetical protein
MMTSSLDRYLAEVRRIVFTRFRPEEADVYLFGSWARGDVRRTSDIDIAIMPKNDADGVTFSLLKEDLEESWVPFQVDVVDLAHVDGPFRERVMAEGVRWTG